jgi:transposase
MNRRNALFAGHDEGGRNWARFASLIATCKMDSVEPYAYLPNLFIKLANGHLAKDIDALMPWACTPTAKPLNSIEISIGWRRRLRFHKETPFKSMK